MPFRLNRPSRPRAETPPRAAATVGGSERFVSGLRRLADELGRPEAVVRQEANRALAEMAAGMTPLGLAVWRRLERLAGHAYRLDVDAVAADHLRRLAHQGPLVFLPSHRSYLDPLILREALRRHGLPPNHVLGGVNVAFWPVGPVARRAGYVFIRRHVRGDPVYRFVLAEYVRYLARRGCNLEWYLEGGRTRTGRIRPPQVGILAYLLRAHRERPDRPTFLVPTSIVYDTLYELGSMEDEEHGAPKPPEGLGWAMRFARAQRHGFGRVYVRFGDPIDLSEQVPGPEPTVDRLAIEVCHRIERATPVTPTALVCLAFSSMGDTSLSAEDVTGALRPFVSYLADRGVSVAGGVDLTSRSGVLATLAALTDRGVLRTSGPQGRADWSMARPFEAAFYRNGAAPHFVNRALAELVAVEAATRPRHDPLPAAWADALRLRRLLEFEFVFGTKRDFASDLRAELALFVPEWEGQALDPAAIWAGLTASRLYVAPRLVRASFDAYSIVAAELASLGDAPAGDEEAFVARCLAAGRRASLRHLIASDEAAAAHPLRSGVRLASHRGLLDGTGPAPSAARAAFAAEIAAVVERLERLAELARGAVVVAPVPLGAS